MKLIVSSIVAFSMLGLLTACSDNDDSSTTSSATTEGVFIDSAVAGLNYTCSSGNSGITSSLGAFTCNTGDIVTFTVGTYELGSCSAAQVVNPYSLYPDDHEAAINIAQLLQTLDSDDNLSNGITPDENLVAQLEGVTVAPTDGTFEAAIAAAGLTLVEESAAEDHLSDSLAENGIAFTAELLNGRTVYYHGIENGVEVFESWSFDGTTLNGSTFEVENGVTTQEEWSIDFILNDDAQIVIVDPDNPGFTEYFKLINTSDTTWTVLSEVVGGAEDIATIEFQLNKPSDFPADVQFTVALLEGKTVYYHDTEEGVEIYQSWSFSGNEVSLKTFEDGVSVPDETAEFTLTDDGVMVFIDVENPGFEEHFSLIGMSDSAWTVLSEVIGGSTQDVATIELLLNKPSGFPQ